MAAERSGRRGAKVREPAHSPALSARDNRELTRGSVGCRRRVERIAPTGDGLPHRRGQFPPSSRRHKIADLQAAAVRRDEQAVRSVGPFLEDHPEPERLELPCPALAPNADPLDREGVTGEPERLALAGAT